MEKRFHVYFKSNSESCYITAHHYVIDGALVKFFKTEKGDADPEIYVSTDAVAAIVPFMVDTSETELPGTVGYTSY